MNIGQLVLKCGTTAHQCINKQAEPSGLESSLPREKMEQLSQALDASYLRSRVPHQHDVNQKGNKL